jgi:hypothetical protein
MGHLQEQFFAEVLENDRVVAFRAWLLTEREADLMPQFKRSSSRSLESHPGKDYTEFR